MRDTTRRLTMWATVIGLLLLVPATLTLLGSGVDGDGFHWTLSDFVVMGTLLCSAALAYELLAQRASTTSSRVAVGVAVVAGLLLVWIAGAVVI